VLVLVVIAGAVLGATAISHVRSATPDYREALVTDERPLSLNPLVGASDAAVRDVGELLYRRLLRLDSQAAPAPDLASGYAVSPDGISYHLPLRPGQLWSDGRPITVADVIATLDWVQSPKFGDAATAAAWRDVHGRAVGDGVSFDLAGPRASFAAQLTQLPILPIGTLTSAQVAALPSSAATAMPTSGALRVVASTATALTLFPNPHAATQVRVNQLELDLYSSFSDAAAAFRARTVDAVLTTDPDQRQQLIGAGGTPHDIASFRFVDLLFNERGAVLADPVVRQAVSTSIDRNLLVSGPLHGMGVPLSGAIPAGVAWAASRQLVPARDIAAAAAALDADGWKLGPDGTRARGGVRLTLRLAVADVVPLPDVAASISAQLWAAGIQATVSTVRPADLTKLLTAGDDYDLALADWDNGPDPDVSSFWRSTAIPPAGFNVSAGQADPFLDQALDSLATLSSLPARVAAAATVSSQLADDLPAVFLETPDVSLVVRAGISVDVPPVGYSSARYDDVTSWHRG
jgi:peptide/nickel transport system substrate-binding protein